jgi:hypothetical protein
MKYDERDLKNTLAIAKGIEYSADGQVVIFKEGKRVNLNYKQLFGLLKKLQFYLELDERCIDRDGPQFLSETKEASDLKKETSSDLKTPF